MENAKQWLKDNPEIMQQLNRQIRELYDLPQTELDMDREIISISK